ncbi:hypothetical protein [Caldalkalibacillus salinus]|uniref:hypothetical protein n=1 Tax=Caldalkalibacillus salinus TaxID=2803787 RepID=UPI00192166C4|nr:hypothetical protein [Caldalkalibacillus salinus]
MRMTVVIMILLSTLVSGCAVGQDNAESFETSITHVQYIGQDDDFVKDLQDVDVQVNHNEEIDLSDDAFKNILIDAEHRRLSRSAIIHALQEGYHVFFVNVVNTRFISQHYLQTDSYEALVEGGSAIVQLLLADASQAKLTSHYIGWDDENDKIEMLNAIEDYRQDVESDS